MNPPTNSPAPVISAQTHVHHRLHEVVKRHMQSPWQFKPHGPSVSAFQALACILENEKRLPLILDSGCGTGSSSRNIAAVYPNSWVIGIDQSAHRLARTGAKQFPHRQGNIIWLRAELANFWFLARQAGWKLSRHYLLYPNPWPKASQLRRRWHGHPVFPTLLALGGVLELRCNWEVYAHEFAAALGQVRHTAVDVQGLQSDAVSSAFESKYRSHGMRLFQVKFNLGS